jgi:thymidylate synthase (FAD)
MIETNLIDYMGTDLSVVNAARVSFGKVSEYDYGPDGYEMRPKDVRLINYLAKHKHLSPFGHCFASFHVKAPIFVARQLVKHKFLRINEISRRYVSSDPEYFTPVLREALSDKKQGSGCPLNLPVLDEVVRHQQIDSTKQYLYLLAMGVCEEQARMVLPLNTMTEWYWSGSLDAFADMCRLRCAPDTQVESRMVANQVYDKMVQIFPISWKALLDDGS